MLTIGSFKFQCKLSDTDSMHYKNSGKKIEIENLFEIAEFRAIIHLNSR